MSCIADSGTDVPVLELQRVGCELVKLSIDEITTDSVARAFKVQLKTVKVIVNVRSTRALYKNFLVCSGRECLNS